MGLYVGIFGAKQFHGPFDGQAFGNIHEFTTAIIAFVRIAFCIFVGQNAALDHHHRTTGNIFRGNQLQVAALPLQLLVDHTADFRVDFPNEIFLQTAYLFPDWVFRFCKIQDQLWLRFTPSPGGRRPTNDERIFPESINT